MCLGPTSWEEVCEVSLHGAATQVRGGAGRVRDVLKPSSLSMAHMGIQTLVASAAT